MLELKNITVKAEDGKTILKNLDFSVGDSRFVAITGPNGGGKSTLVKVIMGIMKPEEGQVIFEGRDITALSVAERARLGIAMAFQQPVRFKGIAVKDILDLATGEDLDEPRVCAYLSEVGLCAKDYMNRPVDASLSGGEIKRIEIASIIARKARLSLFDEPEAGIDLWSFQNLLDVFKKIRNEADRTVLIVSHQERILEIADEIVVLSAGAVVSRGTPGKILPRILDGEERCGLCPKKFLDTAEAAV